MDSVSIYLHIPFCERRCGYCDFNTYAGLNRLIPDYVDALQTEMRRVQNALGQRLPAHTVFFGGGTPSLLSARQLSEILNTLSELFEVAADAEISMEANPGTVTLAELRDYRAAGVNRLSFGLQSAHPQDLHVLDRAHTYLTANQAIAWARQAGFDNYNVDLIFGAPGQTLERWERTLELTRRLDPRHVSLYALTIEHGTRLKRVYDRGLMQLVDDDLTADMYDLATAFWKEAGFVQYEISNWASSEAHTCRHNLQYWRNLPYFGFGAGAHGFYGGSRQANIRGILPYIRAAREGVVNLPAGPAVDERTPVSRQDEMEETMMVGLRLVREGVGAERFEQRFGLSIEEAFPEATRQTLASGLVEWTAQGEEKRLRLTERGRFLSNQVFMQFLSLKD